MGQCACTTDERELEPLPKVSSLWPVRSGEVVLIQTSPAGETRLGTSGRLRLDSSKLTGGNSAVIVLDPSVRYQTFLGFGGAFTESAAQVFHALPSRQQEEVLQAYFHPELGLGYRLGRIHMNSCDFSSGNWSCCDTQDEKLESFTVERYQEHIFPMMRRAAAVAGALLWLVATPWSPPAWMKTNGRMCNGGKLKLDCRAAWARHYVLFAAAMEAEGLPLSAFTVQNEPEAGTRWETCFFTAEDERDFVRDFLGPALVNAGMQHLKLIIHDHNRDTLFMRARTILTDAVAASFVWGVGFHWYGDPRFECWADPAGQACFENVRKVHELRPQTHLLMTEACQERVSSCCSGAWAAAERYAESIIKDLNNWTEGWLDWNLLLDGEGGPNHVNNTCFAPLTFDHHHGTSLVQPSFFYIGHFSRHIQPGAQRIACSSTRDALEATAFVNPNGTIVVVVLNRQDSDLEFVLDLAGAGCVDVHLPAHSISTLLARI